MFKKSNSTEQKGNKLALVFGPKKTINLLPRFK